MTENNVAFESWCIVEVMGHSKYAGFVSEQKIAGARLVRVDVPECEGRPAFTKLLGVASIFAITPCTESVARAAVKSFFSRPFSMFELPMLPAPRAEDRMDYVDDDDDDSSL